MVCATRTGSDQPADQSICLSLRYSMTVKLLTERHLGSLSLKGGCTGSSESTLVKMPYCWRSHVESPEVSSIMRELAGYLSLFVMCKA